MAAIGANNRKWRLPLARTGCILALALVAYWTARTVAPGLTDASRSARPYLHSPLAAAVFFAMGAWLHFSGLLQRQQDSDSVHWPTTEGQVVENCEVQLSRYSRAPGVICDYTVGGRQYRTDPIVIDATDASIFKPGKIMALKYDPADPENHCRRPIKHLEQDRAERVVLRHSVSADAHPIVLGMKPKSFMRIERSRARSA